jgi:hypothetical protein
MKMAHADAANCPGRTTKVGQTDILACPLFNPNYLTTTAIGDWSSTGCS